MVLELEPKEMKVKEIKKRKIKKLMNHSKYN
jgi:hypothetical protein